MWRTILQVQQLKQCNCDSKIRQLFLDFIFNVQLYCLKSKICGIGHHVTLGYHDSKNFIKPCYKYIRNLITGTQTI